MASGWCCAEPERSCQSSLICIKSKVESVQTSCPHLHKTVPQNLRWGSSSRDVTSLNRVAHKCFHALTHNDLLCCQLFCHFYEMLSSNDVLLNKLFWFVVNKLRFCRVLPDGVVLALWSFFVCDQCFYRRCVFLWGTWGTNVGLRRRKVLSVWLETDSSDGSKQKRS